MCGCCDAANGGPKGFLCKYFFGCCAIGNLMSYKGGEGEGPQAVAEPGNCFVCCILGNYCSCCNYGASPRSPPHTPHPNCVATPLRSAGAAARPAACWPAARL